MPVLRISVACLALALPTFALAQTPTQALANQFAALCLGATPGSALAQRCAEIAAGGPNARSTAAAGSFLDEIPGQGRSSTRDGAANIGDVAEVRQSISARLSVFASIDGGRLDRRDSPNEAPFSGDTQTATVGLDWAPTSKLTLGAALNHSRESLDYRRSDGSSRARYLGLIGFGSWNASDSFSIDAYAGRLDGSNDLRRAIDFTLPGGVRVNANAAASLDSTRTLAGLGLGWSVPKGAWQWQFGAGLDIARTRLEAYSETGARGFELSVPGRQISTRRGRLDASLARNVSTRWGVWQPLARIGWRHEYANPARALSVRFSGDAGNTAITFDTEDPDTGWGEAALGSVFVFTRGHSGFVEYRQRFGHAFLQERVLALGWRLELR